MPRIDCGSSSPSCSTGRANSPRPTYEWQTSKASCERSRNGSFEPFRALTDFPVSSIYSMGCVGFRLETSAHRDKAARGPAPSSLGASPRPTQATLPLAPIRPPFNHLPRFRLETSATPGTTLHTKENGGRSRRLARNPDPAASQDPCGSSRPPQSPRPCPAPRTRPGTRASPCPSDCASPVPGPRHRRCTRA